MLEKLTSAIRSQRASLCARWESLLRAESPNTPLANPEILVFKIPEACGEILDRMALPSGEAREETSEPYCACGLNPLLGFFAAGEQAMEEAMLRAIHTVPHMTMADQSHAMGELHQILRALKGKEIAMLCSVCQLRHVAPYATTEAQALSTRSR